MTRPEAMGQSRGMTFAHIVRPIVLSAVVSLTLLSPAVAASAQSNSAPDVVLQGRSQVPAPATENLARGASTGDRAVVVLEGGGSPHAFTTPWDACDGGRATYVQGLANAGIPVFTAPGYGNFLPSTTDKTGCPAQPPVEVQWNTSGYPTQAGQAVLGFLGYLNATYGYRTFDLVGYSWGGIVARATVAALKQASKPVAMAPAFSYAQSAVDAGVTIPSLVTINSPHLGGPSYDIALDPTKYYAPVVKAWGPQYAEHAKGLISYQQALGAGSIQVLSTLGHAKKNPATWDATQPGVLDGVQVTLMAGDYCGRTCGVDRTSTKAQQARAPRTDGTVPVYSQLMLPCPSPCPAPPGSVYLPPGMVPDNVVRKTFPTLHSAFDTKGYNLPESLSVAKNPEAIAYLVETVTHTWRAAGAPLLTPSP